MVFQYRPEWSGTTGGPGVTVFNARLSAFDGGDPQDFADHCAEFFDALAGLIPDEVDISFPAEVVELDTSTGTLIGVVPVTAPATVSGTSSGTYAMPAGARIDWVTEAIVAGHRLRGRTYIVPCSSGAFEANGTLASGTVTALQTIGEAFVDGMSDNGSLAVWSRTHGIVADISGVLVPDQVAVLRSRRD